MNLTNEIRAHDAERAEIERLFAQWTAAGNLPELVTTCRPEKTMTTMAQQNVASWENGRG